MASMQRSTAGGRCTSALRIASATTPIPRSRPTLAVFCICSTGMSPMGTGEVSIRTSEATRCGCASAKRMATMPPSECPSRSQRSIARASRKPSRSATWIPSP